jgi:hypothetical protein
MDTLKKPDSSAEHDRDTQAILERIMTGKPLDPDTYRRVWERGECLTEQIRRDHGTVDVAVELVRDTRDEE